VRVLPEGIYLSNIKQTGSTINLQGFAQSSARVSTLMRNLDASPWLEAPALIEIKAATVQGLRANAFNLNVQQTLSQASPDDKDKKGGKP
jgi:type IV pilus assembly protein PilN